MNPPSAGVRAVLWPGRTKREYKPGAWDTSHKQGAIYKINTRRRGRGGDVSQRMHTSSAALGYPTNATYPGTCQSTTALGIWSMPRIQPELGRNAEMRWCSGGLLALGCWAGGPTRGWKPRQANGEKHGDQGTATLGKSMHPLSAGVRAVLWPGRTKVGYEPRAWDTSHKQGAVNATP